MRIMINVVYCCICYFIVFCQCQDIYSEDYTNDTPYQKTFRVTPIRVKMGTNITLKCNISENNKVLKNSISWQFQSCSLPPDRDMICDNDVWTDIQRGKMKLKIYNSSKENVGHYKCLEDGYIRSVYMLEVISYVVYDVPPPKVISVMATNLTGSQNIGYTISCNISSEYPPEVLWFKQCNGHMCEIKDNGTCFCHLNTSNSFFKTGMTNYLSKISIVNARDVDSGIYACLGITRFGKSYKTVSLTVPVSTKLIQESSFSLLFLIPIAFILAPIIIWVCYFRKKKKSVTVVVDQQKRLISTVRLNDKRNGINLVEQ